MLVIVALGESVVAIGADVEIHHISGHPTAIVMGLALPADLWWTYFSDARVAAPTLAAADPRTRARLAAREYALQHYLLLGVVAATGIHAAVTHPDRPAGTGRALPLPCPSAFRRPPAPSLLPSSSC
ncbi:low temperature requirement protein A [Micromonospora sp. NPDC003776]